VFTVELPRAGHADHPRLVLIRSNLSKAQASVDLANQSRAVPPAVGFSVRNQRDNLSPVSRALGVHLQIPIGTDIQGKPLQTEAQTRMAIAQAELSLLETTLANDIETVRSQLALEQEGLEQATQRANLAAQHLGLIKKAFDLGERGLIDLLRAQILNHDSIRAKTKQQLAVNLAISRLNQAIGVLP
jgi:outer membrane protein TolC